MQTGRHGWYAIVVASGIVVALVAGFVAFGLRGADAGGQAGTPTPVQTVYVEYTTGTGDIRGWAEYLATPGTTKCPYNGNGTTPGPGLACLDISRDPNLKTFLDDVHSGHMSQWQVKLDTQTLQRRP